MKKPIITQILLIVFIILLFFFTIFMFIRENGSKEQLRVIVETIDIKKYLYDLKEVNILIEEKRLDKEIFSYIDEVDKTIVINNVLDNLYNNKDYLIESSEIKSILRKAIVMYENENSLDIYSNIENEIDEISFTIASNINNKDFMMQFYFIYKIVNSSIFYILLLILIVLFVAIFVIEKSLGFSLNGLVFFISFVGLLIFHKNFIPNYIKGINMLKYFNEGVISNFIMNLSDYYLIEFIIGICLLAIYGIIYLKKILRKMRIIFYDNYFGR